MKILSAQRIERNTCLMKVVSSYPVPFYFQDEESKKNELKRNFFCEFCRTGMSATTNDDDDADAITPMSVVVEALDRNAATKKTTSKMKSTLKRSVGDVLELTTAADKKRLSHKFRHNSEDADLQLRVDERANANNDSSSTTTADGTKKTTKFRSASMSSLSSFKTKKSRPQYFRSHSRQVAGFR